MASEPTGLTAADRLADALLPYGRPGRPVLLACSDQALAGAGLDARALVAAVRADGGLAGAALVAVSETALSPGRVPTYLPALCLLVLAASRMGEDDTSAAAYYARLAELWGPPDRPGHPPYRKFAELCGVGFPALAEWLAGDQGGRRGLLDLPEVAASRRHVGVPISQAALRAADVRWLGGFFADRARHLDAGWDAAGTLMHHPARRQLTRPAAALLDDPVRRPLLSAALNAARTAWDGTRADPDGRRVLPGELTLHLDALAGTAHLSLRAGGLTGDEDGRGPDGPVRVPAPPGQLNVPLAWLGDASDGPVRVLLDGRRALHALPGPLAMFEVTDGGLQAVSVATGKVWALTCLVEVNGGDEVAVALPDGWRLMADVPAEALPDGAAAPDPGTARPGQLAAVAGLPLSDGAWLAERAPAVAGPPDLQGHLLVDGLSAGLIGGSGSVRLSGLDGQPGLYEVACGELRLDVLLAASGLREQTGTLGWGGGPAAAQGPSPGQRGLVGALDVNDPGLGAGHAVPWTRSRGLVWALRADGTMTPHTPPDPDGWLRSVGWRPGGAWPLPEGTVWACDPQKGTVTLLDAAAAPVAPGDGAAHCTQFLAGAEVRPPEARAVWDALCAACREAGLV